MERRTTFRLAFLVLQVVFSNNFQVNCITISPPGDENGVVDIFEDDTQIFTCSASLMEPAIGFQWYVGMGNLTDKATYHLPEKLDDRIISASTLAYTVNQNDQNNTVHCEVMKHTGEKEESVKIIINVTVKELSIKPLGFNDVVNVAGKKNQIFTCIANYDKPDIKIKWNIDYWDLTRKATQHTTSNDNITFTTISTLNYTVSGRENMKYLNCKAYRIKYNTKLTMKAVRKMLLTKVIQIVGLKYNSMEVKNLHNLVVTCQYNLEGNKFHTTFYRSLTPTVVIKGVQSERSCYSETKYAYHCNFTSKQYSVVIPPEDYRHEEIWCCSGKVDDKSTGTSDSASVEIVGTRRVNIENIGGKVFVEKSKAPSLVCQFIGQGQHFSATFYINEIVTGHVYGNQSDESCFSDYNYVYNCNFTTKEFTSVLPMYGYNEYWDDTKVFCCGYIDGKFLGCSRNVRIEIVSLLMITPAENSSIVAIAQEEWKTFSCVLKTATSGFFLYWYLGGHDLTSEAKETTEYISSRYDITSKLQYRGKMVDHKKNVFCKATIEQNILNITSEIKTLWIKGCVQTTNQYQQCMFYCAKNKLSPANIAGKVIADGIKVYTVINKVYAVETIITPFGEEGIIIIEQGKTQSFDCIANTTHYGMSEDSNTVKIHWYVGSRNVTNQAIEMSSKKGKDKSISSRFLLTGVVDDSNKTIYCEAVFDRREKKKSLSVTIYVFTLFLTEVTLTPFGTDVVYFGKHNLETFICTTNVCNPPANIQWYIGDRNVTEYAKSRTTLVDGINFLTSSVLKYYSQVTDNNALIYCVALQGEGQKVNSLSKQLVTDDIYLISIKKGQFESNSENLMLTCQHSEEGSYYYTNFYINDNYAISVTGNKPRQFCYADVPYASRCDFESLRFTLIIPYDKDLHFQKWSCSGTVDNGFLYDFSIEQYPEDDYLIAPDILNIECNETSATISWRTKFFCESTMFFTLQYWPLNQTTPICMPDILTNPCLDMNRYTFKNLQRATNYVFAVTAHKFHRTSMSRPSKCLTYLVETPSSIDCRREKDWPEKPCKAGTLLLGFGIASSVLFLLALLYLVATKIRSRCHQKIFNQNRSETELEVYRS